MGSRPHVSEALRHTRPWVTLAGAVVVCCAIAQMLVFAMVHYTDVRWTEIKPVEQERPTVVDARVPGRSAKPQSERSEGEQTGAAPSDVNRVLSTTDVVLRRVSNLAVTAGVIGVIGLAVMTAMGVVVAGGGAVQGVEKAVAACFWAVVLALVCLPWTDLMPSVAISGVFSPYGVIVESSEGVGLAGAGSSEVSLLGRFVLLPMVAAVGAALVVLGFRAGVERGIIITSMSEFDEKIEKEISTIRSRGVTGKSSRALGAFNQALSDHEQPSGRAAARDGDEGDSVGAEKAGAGGRRPI